MFTVTKRIEVSGAHFLHLDYESKCTNLHGHNWIITVTVQNDTLDHNGMVVDFSKIKEIVNQFDHHVINDVLGGTESDGGEHREVALRPHSSLYPRVGAGDGRECGNV